MRIGIVHTVGSPCRCAESFSQGLKVLGHEPVLTDSEEIELRAGELARTCDLIVDHTDTFKGRGLFRAFVRQVLESAGSKIVGSDSRACFLADNKIAAKARLSALGLPVPPGIVISRKNEEIPSWLRPPLILKPAFEHMSRGLKAVQTLSEARSAANELLDSQKQPILIETYIPGREIAVSILDGPDGLQALPLLEWVVDAKAQGILTEAFKLTEPPPNRRDALRADLPPKQREEIQALSLAAFKALGLRDYARFDLRLSEAGQPFFLEANITPSLEPQEALALSASWAGLKYPGLVERMLFSAQKRYGENLKTEEADVGIDLPTGRLTMTVPTGVHVPPQSTIDLAGILDIKPGERVLELGCGSGLLSIAAIRSGAAYVLATDSDPDSLKTTLVNARRNGIAHGLEAMAGSWYEAVPQGEKQKGFDVIIATPPQTPGHRPFGPKYGGFDGTRHLLHIVDRAPLFLKPQNGRIWMLAISLANPNLLLQRLRERFSEVRVLKETNRFFTAKEYEGYGEGLVDHLRFLKKNELCEFREVPGEGYVFRNLFICARGPRKESV